MALKAAPTCLRRFCVRCIRAVLDVHSGREDPKTRSHRQNGFALEPGARGFFDSESNLPRLKSTHVADCKPQAPPGRRWDFALELGYERFLQIKLGPAGWLSS